MSKSIERQLMHAVYDCFTPGHSKRADKFNAAIDTSWKIYSTSSKRDMLDLAKDFGKFLNEQHPDVRWAYGINHTVIQAYIDSKAETCVDKTLGKIVSRIGMLERCCKHTYRNSPLEWKAGQLVQPVSIKNAEFVKDTPVPLEVSKLVIEAIEKRRSQVCNAVRLSAFAGMRANETVNLKAGNVRLAGGQFGYGWIEVIKGVEGGAKGGRPRIIPIVNAEAQQAIQQAIAGKKPDEYVAARADGRKMTPDNVQRVLREIMDARYSHQYKGNRCHGMRKTWAQMYYDVVRNSGCTRSQTISRTNEVLGHGAKRGVEMVQMYVANIW